MEKRQRLPNSAYTWAREQLPNFIDYFNACTTDANASATYHGMVDGLVWSDELPINTGPDGHIMRQLFCVLVYLRTSVILDQVSASDEKHLLRELQERCPSWSFMQQDRWDQARRVDYQRLKLDFFSELERYFSECPKGRNL